MLLRAATIFASLALAGAAMAATERPTPSASAPSERESDTLDQAGHAATQPARDLGLAKTKIPPVLERAIAQPYASPGKGCKRIVAQVAELNAALGPDFDSNSAKNKDKFGKLASSGIGAVAGSLIPFRGLVREASGAASAERKLAAAINAGVARRGFLRGLAVSQRCRIPTG